jgi:hypothetical protein
MKRMTTASFALAAVFGSMLLSCSSDDGDGDGDADGASSTSSSAAGTGGAGATGGMLQGGEGGEGGGLGGAATGGAATGGTGVGGSAEEWCTEMEAMNAGCWSTETGLECRACFTMCGKPCSVLESCPVQFSCS